MVVMTSLSQSNEYKIKHLCTGCYNKCMILHFYLIVILYSIVESSKNKLEEFELKAKNCSFVILDIFKLKKTIFNEIQVFFISHPVL